MTDNKKLKYFIYCRKSSEDDKRQFLSIEAQIRELKEYAAKSNLNVVEVFVESQTAFKIGREVFNRMMGYFEEGVANALLSWKPDRLARNAFDGGRIIQALDDGVIQEIRTPYECFKREDNRVMLYIHFGMSNDYSRQISANVRRGIRQKYERGEYPNLAPIGYLNGKVSGSKNIYPDPERKDLVVRLFTEFSTGKYSLGQLTKTAFGWGLRTRKNKPISKGHLHRILQNPLYYGWFEHGGELRLGSYEPLITKRLFGEVQAVLQNRAKPKKIENEWAYAGLLKCGSGCGASIIFETKKKFYKKTNRWATYTYARCSKRCGTCNEKGVTIEDMEAQIDEKLQQITISEDDWRLGIKLLNKKYEAEAKQRAQIVESRQRQYQRLQSELDGYFKMRAREEMNADEFATKKQTIIEEQTKLKEVIDDGLHGQRTWLELAEEFLTNAFYARDMLLGDDLAAKRKVVEKIGWNVLLKDKKLVWTYQKPYDILLKPEYRTDLRESWDNFRTAPWIDIIDYPELTLKENQEILALQYAQ